jgi:hypothetical protein
MIFRRYGSAYQSVELNFDSKALNEIGFRRDRVESIEAEDFGSCVQIAKHELVAEAEGPVQDETEQVLLDRLKEKLLGLDRALGPAEFLVVENEQGNDWPKTRQVTTNVVVQGENRLYFNYSVAPAMRVTVRRRPG